MKILIWTQHFRPETFRINEVAEALSNSGQDVTVLTGKPNYPEGKIYQGYTAFGTSKETFGEVKIYRIPVIPRGRGSAINLTLNYLSFIFFGLIFAPVLLRKQKFDKIFVYATSPLLQALPAILISRLKSASLIIWVQDLWPESLKETGFIKNRFLLWIVGIIVRYIYKKADLILIQSEGFREPVSRLVKDRKKIRLLMNPAEAIKEGLINKDSLLAQEIGKNFSIVFTGNIGSVQSCETIIEAAYILKDVPEIQFFLIGNGSRYEAISSLVKEKNLTNVTMPGKLPYEDMHSVLSASTALLISLKDLPTLSATIPSKLSSYFSAGKPIIASINGEAAKIITEAEAGLVSPAEDASALANSIMKLYRLPKEKIAKLGKNAENYFRINYDIDNFSKKLIDYLN